MGHLYWVVLANIRLEQTTGISRFIVDILEDRFALGRCSGGALGGNNHENRSVQNQPITFSFDEKAHIIIYSLSASVSGSELGSDHQSRL